jgi:hypothetical protein
MGWKPLKPNVNPAPTVDIQPLIDRLIEKREDAKPGTDPKLKELGESRTDRGVKLIRLIFAAFEGMGEIDGRQVVGPDGDKTYLGLAYLLGHMGLSMGRENDKKKMKGMLTVYMEGASDASKACDGFAVWLKTRADKIFTWIKILEPVLTIDEANRMGLIMDSIMQFMSDFEIVIPQEAASVYGSFNRQMTQ